MSFKLLSNAELVSKLKFCVSEERKILTEILHLLREVEARRLYALYGYSSLFAFTVHELGYEESSAYRRIEAMRLLKTLSVDASKKVEASLETGRMSLTNLSALQSFIKKKEVHEKKKLNLEEKKELLEKIEGKSTRECQSLLVNLDPELVAPASEKERALPNHKTELKIIISNELLQKLKRVQELRAHANPEMTYAEIIEYVTEVTLNKMDPDRRKVDRRAQDTQELNSQELNRSQKPRTLPAPEVARKPPTVVTALPAPKDTQVSSEIKSSKMYFQNNSPSNRPSIPAHIKRAIWLRDQGCCTYRNPETGRQCGSRFAIQFEHKIPVSKQGDSSESNIILLCRSHNLAQAIQEFGMKKMSPYFK